MTLRYVEVLVNNIPVKLEITMDLPGNNGRGDARPRVKCTPSQMPRSPKNCQFNNMLGGGANACDLAKSHLKYPLTPDGRVIIPKCDMTQEEPLINLTDLFY